MPVTDPHQFQAVAIPGLERATASEALLLGAVDVQTAHGSVTFGGALELGYRANLWLRSAARVRLRLSRFHAAGVGQLARAARDFDWSPFITAGAAVEISATLHASTIASADLAARVVREAIDARVGGLVEPRPDLPASQHIDVRLARDGCTLSIDMSGERLDRRGYRLEVGPAPLREHLAAALLLISEWEPRIPFVDPMCGSGTLPIEAALRALEVAPGLDRDFAFAHWPCLDRDGWQEMRGAARRGVRDRLPAPVIGSDRNAGQIGIARRNAERAGLLPHLVLERRAFADLEPPAAHGLLLFNPPFGKRVTPDHTLAALYRDVRDLLDGRWRGWSAAVISSGPALEELLGPRVTEVVPFRHGGLRCRLLRLAPRD